MGRIRGAEGCLDAEQVAAFMGGGGELGGIETHAADCHECRALLSALARTAALDDDRVVLASSVGTIDGDGPVGAELRPGTHVGRYRVLARLGAGGMGVVYLAHDPELNRKVALKILRQIPGSEGGDPAALRARLRREAQAMAQLTHPHVVAVHDVGELGDRIFVAMEFVDGQTLAAWLAVAPRSWREVLARLVPAGEGLAAAHAVGLVHRDFKPDNVFIGRDGRVRVGDFGLARTVGEAEHERAESGACLPIAPSSGLRTVTGALVGTPLYMAPEQFLGLAADARSDQFSFCVTLYSAIVGQRPYEGETLVELAAALLAGRLRPPPRPDPLPPWLRGVLMRGLAIDPAARYPSMAALLTALGRDPRRRRRQLAAVLVPLATLALGALLVNRPAATRDRRLGCSEGAKTWPKIWDPARARRVEQAFARTGAPLAADASAIVTRELDSYARAWTSALTEACADTFVRGEQSEALLDLRLACLDVRLREGRALVDTFLDAGPAVVAHAARMVGSLGVDLARCADVKTLATPPATHIPKPSDDATPDCQERVRPQKDPNTGRTWVRVWYCHNDRHAPIYEHPRLGEPLAYMESVDSWFVCYRRGDGRVDDDVWYYTQGDEYTPSGMRRLGWGYAPAAAVHARVHPYPGIPPCPEGD